MTPQFVPYFEHAPVVERVLGVQFQPIAGFHAGLFGAFWKTLGDDWPKANDAGPIEPQYVEFENERLSLIPHFADADADAAFASANPESTGRPDDPDPKWSFPLELEGYFGTELPTVSRNPRRVRSVFSSAHGLSNHRVGAPAECGSLGGHLLESPSEGHCVERASGLGIFVPIARSAVGHSRGVIAANIWRCVAIRNSAAPGPTAC